MALRDSLDRRRDREDNVRRAKVYGPSGRGSLYVIMEGSAVPIEAAAPQTWAPGTRVVVARDSTDLGGDHVVISGPPPSRRGGSRYAPDNPAGRPGPVPSLGTEIVGVALGTGESIVGTWLASGAYDVELWRLGVAILVAGSPLALAPDGLTAVGYTGGSTSSKLRLYDPGTPAGTLWDTGDVDAIGGDERVSMPVWAGGSWWFISWYRFTTASLAPRWRLWTIPPETMIPAVVGSLTRARDTTGASPTQYAAEGEVIGSPSANPPMLLAGPARLILPNIRWADGLPPGAQSSIDDVAFTYAGAGAFSGTTAVPSGGGPWAEPGSALSYGWDSAGIVSADLSLGVREYDPHLPGAWWAPVSTADQWTVSAGSTDIAIYDASSGLFVAAPEAGPYTGDPPVSVTLDAEPDSANLPYLARLGTGWPGA